MAVLKMLYMLIYIHDMMGMKYNIRVDVSTYIIPASAPIPTRSKEATPRHTIVLAIVSAECSTSLLEVSRAQCRATSVFFSTRAPSAATSLSGEDHLRIQARALFDVTFEAVTR